jgi:hypothetical protein
VACVSDIKYPIYIVSKGRAYNPKTAKIFLKENIPFKIAVEPQEVKEYENAVGKEHVLELPFSNLGQGSTPARNFVWDYSIKAGHKRHYVFDDNITSFAKLSNGKRIYNYSALESFLCLEKLTDNFRKIALSGFNYAGFVTRETKKPFQINTHVYSGILINNDIPFRWRLKYNEDVDLCLQALHKKWNTILLNAFLIDKTSTATKQKGGNQTELYKNNDPEMKFLKAKTLAEQWPQYAKITKRFDRIHHFVDWKKHFQHPLVKEVQS